MSFEITGTLIEKSNEQQVSDKFKKREFVLEKTENNFAEQIKFQAVQDKTAIIDPFKVGDQIKVTFDIKGRKWKDAYFVNLQAWKVEKMGESQQVANTPTVEDIPAPTAEDDLPF